ncbi:MAG: hypothetical protein WA919_23905, partial [Coleofasciculaceae cyanobacterium]
QATDYYQQALVISQEIGDKATEEDSSSRITLKLEPLLFQAPPPVQQEVRLYQEGIQLSKQGQYQEVLAGNNLELVDTLLACGKLLPSY